MEFLHVFFCLLPRILVVWRLNKVVDFTGYQVWYGECGFVMFVLKKKKKQNCAIWYHFVKLEVVMRFSPYMSVMYPLHVFKKHSKLCSSDLVLPLFCRHRVWALLMRLYFGCKRQGSLMLSHRSRNWAPGRTVPRPSHSSAETVSVPISFFCTACQYLASAGRV